MIKDKIIENLKKAIKEKILIDVSIPENEKFGHYSTNVALRLAKEKKANPINIAQEIFGSINNAAPKGFFEKTRFL